MVETKISRKRTTTNKHDWSQRAAYAIGRAMIKGNDPYRRVTVEDVDVFLSKHRYLIEDIIPHIPRGMSSLGAAVCKCAIFYNKRRTIEFLQNFRAYLFTGDKDPVFLFHRWFYSKHRKIKDHAATYGLTLRACRAWCEYRELTELRSRELKDIFEWNADWTPIPLDQKMPSQETQENQA